MDLVFPTFRATRIDAPAKLCPHSLSAVYQGVAKQHELVRSGSSAADLVQEALLQKSTVGRTREIDVSISNNSVIMHGGVSRKTENKSCATKMMIHSLERDRPKAIHVFNMPPYYLDGVRKFCPNSA